MIKMNLGKRVMSAAIWMVALSALAMSAPLLTWQRATVSSSGNVGQYTSIAVGADGHPHISYYDATNGDLMYARRGPAVGCAPPAGSSWCWFIERVDSSGTVGMYTSIALGKYDSPHISYYDFTNGNLKYARKTATGWTVYTVDSTGNVGRSSSLAVTSTGSAHISYYDLTNGNLKYARFTCATLEGGTPICLSYTEIVDSEGDVGTATSIALDGFGRPHISYGTGYIIDDPYAYGPTLKYAWRTSLSRWTRETVYSVGFWGRSVLSTDIALDAGGRRHISYVYTFARPYSLEGWGASVRDANLGDSGWNTEYVGGDFASGRTSIALDSTGNPHISYCIDMDPLSGLVLDGDLKYAVKTAPTRWYIETVDSLGSVGLHASIDLDSSDQPHISYYDQTNGNLKYAVVLPPISPLFSAGSP